MLKRSIFYGFLLSICLGQNSLPFEIDVRPRVLENEKVIVTVQITRFVDQAVAFLEGFLEEKTGTGHLLQEKRLILIYDYEPSLFHGASIAKSEIFSLNKTHPNQYEFKISKVRFRGDKRLFTWHPKSGFIRID